MGLPCKSCMLCRALMTRTCWSKVRLLGIEQKPCRWALHAGSCMKKTCNLVYTGRRPRCRGPASMPCVKRWPVLGLGIGAGLEAKGLLLLLGHILALSLGWPGWLAWWTGLVGLGLNFDLGPNWVKLGPK